MLENTMKQQYVTDDGTTFENAEDAQRYESVVGKKQIVLDWAATRYNSRLVTKNTNVILDWESFRDDVMQPV